MFNTLLEKVNAQPDSTVGLVKEGPVYFLVLNDPKTDNTFDDDKIDRISLFLDEVNNSTGPACLVTIAVGKCFSTGFNLKYWGADPMNAFHSVANMQRLYAKLLTVNVPTMCVI